MLDFHIHKFDRQGKYMCACAYSEDLLRVCIDEDYRIVTLKTWKLHLTVCPGRRVATGHQLNEDVLTPSFLEIDAQLGAGHVAP